MWIVLDCYEIAPIVLKKRPVMLCSSGFARARVKLQTRQIWTYSSWKTLGWKSAHYALQNSWKLWVCRLRYAGLEASEPASWATHFLEQLSILLPEMLQRFTSSQWKQRPWAAMQRVGLPMAPTSPASRLASLPSGEGRHSLCHLVYTESFFWWLPLIFWLSCAWWPLPRCWWPSWFRRPVLPRLWNSWCPVPFLFFLKFHG